MKKLFLLVSVLFSISLFAKDEQKIFIQSGDLSFLKDPALAQNVIDFSKTIIVEFDDDKVKLNHGTFEEYNAERGEDYVNSWPNVQQSIAGFGLNKFNNKKGLHTISFTKDQMALMSEKELKTAKSFGAILPDQEIKYQMNITVDTIDLGDTGAAVASMVFAGFAPSDAGGCIVIGSMEVVNLETNTSVCTLRFRHCKGSSSTTETARIGNGISAIYTEMIKFAKKNK